MKGYRFYAELDEAAGSKSGTKQRLPFTRRTLVGLAETGLHHNCIAVLLDGRGQPLYQGSTMNMDAWMATSPLPNSPVTLGSVGRDYLRDRCVRIDDDLARRLHPRLVKFLEEP